MKKLFKAILSYMILGAISFGIGAMIMNGFIDEQERVANYNTQYVHQLELNAKQNN